jgi:hypothetical protein
VRLVDAQGVDPQRAISVLMSQLVQRFKKVLSNVDAYIVADDVA